MLPSPLSYYSSLKLWNLNRFLFCTSFRFTVIKSKGTKITHLVGCSWLFLCSGVTLSVLGRPYSVPRWNWDELCPNQTLCPLYCLSVHHSKIEWELEFLYFLHCALAHLLKKYPTITCELCYNVRNCINTYYHPNSLVYIRFTLATEPSIE